MGSGNQQKQCEKSSPRRGVEHLQTLPGGKPLEDKPKHGFWQALFGSDTPVSTAGKESAEKIHQSPLLNRLLTNQEMCELLVVEGVLAHVALGAGCGFVLKRICTNSRSTKIFVLEADSRVPSVFFGIQGFDLSELQQLV